MGINQQYAFKNKGLILAMDLSLSCPAFAVGCVEDGQVYILHLSHVKTKSKDSHGTRLRMIFNHLEKVLDEYPNIEYVVREKGFSRHAVTTQALFKVVGISDLVVNHFGHDAVTEIAPLTVKKLITGNGKASKEEVAKDVGRFLATPLTFKTDDESDAVGVLIAYAIQKKLLN